jgi:hypothetical protein
MLSWSLSHSQLPSALPRAVLCCPWQADKPDKPKPKPPTSCGDNKERRDCLKMGAEEGDCAWCEGDFMPASCVGVKAAEWIPEQVRVV